MQGIGVSIAEVLAISTFVFSFLCHVTPKLALFSMSSLFVFQFFLDIFYTEKFACSCPPRTTDNHQSREGYDTIDMQETGTLLENRHSQVQPVLQRRGDNFFSNAIFASERIALKIKQVLGNLLQNKIVKTIAFLLQVVGTLALAVLIWKEVHKSDPKGYLKPIIGLPLSVIVLSIIWSNKVQEFIAAPGNTSCKLPYSARYKAGEFFS